MVTMVTQRMMENLSCMLLAKDEFQANVQARGTAPNNMQDAELARENILLRRQLLEALADNDAISKSLQERSQSLADTTNAKIRAETAAKVLQVQLKSMQTDIDAHKYELHLLKKQLQLRNEEGEHHKKVSEARYKQHLDNVKKIARLESECQRLRGLIRRRLPGPAAIAQMRAECDMGSKKRFIIPTYTASAKNLHNSSSFQAQREIEGLKERLLSVEDEAKFLKEAMTKRTTELQEARQLCARTAMKLSAAQALVESMSTTDTVRSMPSTPVVHPQSGVSLSNGDHVLHAFLSPPDMVLQKSGGFIGDFNSVYASSTISHGSSVDNGAIDVNSELENNAHSTSFNSGELDEVSCAETWASALFAELSHLSNLHESSSITVENLDKCAQFADHEALKCKADNVILNVDMQEHDIHSALEVVNQRLSCVGKSILKSIKDQANLADINSNASLCSTRHNTSIWGTRHNEIDDPTTHKNWNNYILEEVLQIKDLLMDIHRAMEMIGKLGSAGSTKFSSGYANDDELAFNGELNMNQEGHKAFDKERGFSRLRYNSLEDGNGFSAEGTKFSEETDEVEDILSSKLGEQTDKMEGVGTKFSEETDKIKVLATKFSVETDVMEDVGNNFCEIGKTATKLDGDFSNGANIAATAPIRAQQNCSGHAAATAGAQLNLAALADHKVAGEESDVASERDADMELKRQLHALQAELELAHGRIATLEADLARSLQEKAEVVNELSDTRSLKQSLEVELACALASVEDLKLQLSALQLAGQANQLPDGTSSGPFENGPPILAHLNVHVNMKEEQELAVARAQLAGCQHSIHVIRKQMVTEMQHPACHDVISDDQVPFDTSSESSKSIDQSSRLPSPIINHTPCFALSPSKNIITNPRDDTLTPQACDRLHFSTSSRSHALHEDTNLEQFLQNDGHAMEEPHSIEKCKACHVENEDEPFIYLIRSSSKDQLNKPTQQSPTFPKSSATSRISYFFNRAKTSTRASEM